MKLQQKTVAGARPDRAGVRDAWEFSRCWQSPFGLPLADDLQGQLPQRAGGAADEGSDRADGQRGAVFRGRRPEKGAQQAAKYRTIFEDELKVQEGKLPRPGKRVHRRTACRVEGLSG